MDEPNWSEIIDSVIAEAGTKPCRCCRKQIILSDQFNDWEAPEGIICIECAGMPKEKAPWTR